MNGPQARIFLSRVFEALFDPAVPAEEVGSFFTPDYVQIADGKELNHAAFVDHARVLKNLLASGSVTLEKVVANGSTVASMHLVKAMKKTGEQVQIKVHAFFEIENGLIRRAEELTQIIEGGTGDRDLGSRTSALLER